MNQHASSSLTANRGLFSKGSIHISNSPLLFVGTMLGCVVWPMLLRSALCIVIRLHYTTYKQMKFQIIRKHASFFLTTNPGIFSEGSISLTTLSCFLAIVHAQVRKRLTSTSPRRVWRNRWASQRGAGSVLIWCFPQSFDH